jgi:hydroxymethylpyrimidine pyrophosphatase-like HAD family hydrolase
MGNASDDLKAVATLITDDVEDDGLAKALNDLGLTKAVRKTGCAICPTWPG